MIRIARENAPTESNIDFQLADVMTYDLPAESFDCIASIATLHHLPLPEIFRKMKAALKPGGVLLILDLFEPRGVVDAILNPLAVLVSVSLRLIHYGRIRSTREARDAWGRARAPRPLPNHESGPRTLRRSPSRSENQETLALALLNYLAEGAVTSSTPNAEPRAVSERMH
jgi:SAM-dependent methyltransferase